MRYLSHLNWIENQQQEMIERLLAWAEINSGSYHLEGLARMHDALITALTPLHGTIESIPLAPLQQIRDDGNLHPLTFGNVLRVSKRPEAKRRILLCGHMDTVFGQKHDFQSCNYLDSNTVNGPGLADMKGGLMVMITALQAFEQSPMASTIGWEILLNADEEIGSPGSAPLLERSAKSAHVGMVYEPALEDGSLAGARKGSGNFTLVIRGKAAHAGREHHLGRNAIAALAKGIAAIDSLNGKKGDITFNVGKILGGGPVNIVPDLAVCHFNIRINVAEDEHWCLQQLSEIVNALNNLDGIRADLHGHFTRKPKLLSDGLKHLFTLLQECGKEIGIPINHKPTGGCCDGNNLAAAGLPNIDSMGVRGGNLHSAQEYIKLDSLVERTQLSTLMLMKLATNPAWETFSHSAQPVTEQQTFN